MQDIKSIEQELMKNPQLLDLMKIACSCGNDTILSAAEFLMRKKNDTIEFTTGDWGIDADFCLLVNCDSVANGRITNGDKVYIKTLCKEEIKVGDILAVAYDGNEKADLKRLSHVDDNIIVLSCLNPKYDSLIFNKEEFKKVRILGKAVGFTSLM